MFKKIYTSVFLSDFKDEKIKTPPKTHTDYQVMLQSWQQSSALKAAKEAEKQQFSWQKKSKETRSFF